MPLRNIYESRRKPGITSKSTNFLPRCKEILKQAERGLIDLLSEELKNVVHSIKTELESLLHASFSADLVTERNRF